MKSANKGFTIVEIVIAIAVISMVSLTATSLVIFSQNLSQNTRDKFFAVNLCNNSIELFEAAARDEDSTDLNSFYNVFKEGYLRLLGKDLPELENDKAVLYLTSDWEQTVESNAKVTCVMKFELTGEKTIRLDIEIFDHGAVLCTSNYSIALGGQA